MNQSEQGGDLSSLIATLVMIAFMVCAWALPIILTVGLVWATWSFLGWCSG